MMIIDLIDELDLIDGINKHVTGLDKSNKEDIQQLLETAAQQAHEEEWLALNLWLTQISQDITLPLPEIKQALTSQWQGSRELTPELSQNLFPE